MVMGVQIFETKNELGACGASAGARKLRAALAARGEAFAIVATGVSQFELLTALVAEPEIDWSRVTFFHLDEYVGLSVAHPASFRRYLKERLVDRLPTPPAAFHYINAEGDPAVECARLDALIAAVSIDVAFVGIGENGHLAFNDPPADFETEKPYLVVDLDEACRRQQLGEGWFSTLDDVPGRAISMSIRQIMKSAAVVCTVADERKAEAVRAAVEGEVTPQVPASILQMHPDCGMLLDAAAASRLGSDR